MQKNTQKAFLPLMHKGLKLSFLIIFVLLTGCAHTVSNQTFALLPAEMLLFGEQHDAPEHHKLELQVVELLIKQKRLGALVLEMAEQGKSTKGLSLDASIGEVQLALAWSQSNWTWKDYEEIIMAAVQANIEVIGGNLPRDKQHQSMKDASLDLRISPQALMKQREAIQKNHCGLLSDRQELPMTRIQIARDLSMAQTLLKTKEMLKKQVQHEINRTILLIAGGWHVRRDVGVPAHLPTHERFRSILAVAKPELNTTAAQSESALITVESKFNAMQEKVDAIWLTKAPPSVDHCASMQEMLQLKSKDKEIQ